MARSLTDIRNEVEEKYGGYGNKSGQRGGLSDIRDSVNRYLTNREDPNAVIDGEYINQYLQDHQAYWSKYGSGKADYENPYYRLDERRTAIDEWLGSSLADGTIDQEYYDQVTGILGDIDSYVGLYQGQRDAGAYMNDWREWFNQSADALDGLDWSTGRAGGAFVDEAIAGFAERDAETRAWLEENKGRLGDNYYNAMMAELDSYGGYADELRTAYDRNAEYFNQWANQREYDISQMSADELQAQIDNIGVAEDDLAIVNDLLASNMPYSREYAEQDGRDMAVYDMVEQNREYIANKYGLTFSEDYGANYDQLSALVKRLEEGDSPVAYTTADGQNVTWQMLHDSKAASEDLQNRLEEYSRNADWEEMSQGIGSSDDTPSDYSIVFGLQQSMMPYDWEAAEANGYTWDEFEAEEQRRRYIEDKYGVDLHADIYENTRILGQLMEQTNPNVPGEKDFFDSLSYLTDDERAVLNYIYNTQGREAALAWHEGRERMYADRASGALADVMTAYGEESPGLGSIGSVALGIGGSFEQVSDILDYVATGEVGHNMFSEASTSLRSGAMDRYDWMIGDFDAFDFVYGTTMSGVDSYVQGVMFGPAAEVVLGLGAAAQATKDAKDRGMSDKQAFWTGITAGVAEAFFEHISLGNLRSMKEVASTEGREIVKNLAKSMLVNASEETATEFANLMYDWIANGDYSQYETLVRQYIASDIPEDKAIKMAIGQMIGQIIESGASGALMGVGFGVAGQSGPIIGNAIDAAQYNKLPKDVRNSVKRLQGLGIERDAAISTSITLNMGAEAYGDQAAAYMAAYDPKQDAYAYAADFRKAYEIGRNNGNREYLGKLSLNEAQQKIAYELGAAESRKASQEAKAPEVKEEERTYSVSDDGATIDSTGKKVTVKGFSSVGSKVTLELEGGKTIDAKEVSFGTADEAILYETIGQVAGAASTANRILESYETAAKEGMSASDFAAGLRQAYDLGVSGQVAERQLGTYELAGKLPVAARGSAFSRGRAVGQYNATARQAALEARGRQMRGKREGTFHFDRRGRTFDSRRESSLKAMEALSKALGVDIYVYESYKEGGKRVYQDRSGTTKKAPNGFYDAQGIHIDLNAGNFGQGTMMFTVAHELTHFIKEWSPVKFRKLADLLVERYAEQGISVRDLIDKQIVKAKENGRTIDRDTAFEEVVADSMETMLTQGDIGRFMAELKQQDKTLWEKVRDWFKDLAQKLQSVVEQYKGAKPETAEGQLVAQMEDFIQVLQQAYAEALVEAGENYRANEGNKKTTQEGGEMYSLREFEDGTRFVDVDVAPDVFNNMTVAEMNKTAKEILTARFAQKVIGIDNRAFVNGDSVNEYIHPSKSIDLDTRKAKLSASGEIDNLLDAGIPLPNEPDGRDGHVHPDAIDFSYFKTIFKVGNEYFEGIVNIKNIKRGKLFKDVTKIRNITKDIVSSYGENPKSNFLRDASMDSIRNTDPIVNPKSVEKQSARMDVEQKKFSMREPVEYTRNLVALHNLTEDKLAKTLDLGGFPMPSIAITKADIPHTNFGDITLVFGRETIDPKANRKNTVYSADAWTPVFPRTEYEENQDVGNAISRRLRGLEKKVDDHFRDDLRRVYRDIEGTLNRYDGAEGLIQYAMDNYGLKAAYLEEQGKHIEQSVTQVEAEKPYNPAHAERYQKIADILGVESAEEMGAYNLKEARDKHGEELEAIYPGITKAVFRMSRIFGAVKAYMEGQNAGPAYKTVTDAAATRKAVDDALDQAAYEAWVRNLFDGIVKDSGIYNNKPIFTPSGNRRSFKQTHLPVTLENIVKAMASQNGGSTKNVSGFNGIKTLRAGTAERFKSVEAMHKREGRLQNLTTEELEAVNDALQTRLYDIIKAIDDENGGKGSDNSLIRYDTIGEIITEISEGGKFNVSDIQQIFKGYGKEVSDDTALALKQLLFDVAQMPVNIFEAKPERVVDLNEIKAAILPRGTSQKVVDKLRQNGVPVQFYEAGNDAERVALVNGMDDVKFSERDAGAEKVVKALEKQNAKLKEDVKDLRELLRLQGKLTRGQEFKKSSIDAAVKGLAKEAMATLDAEDRKQLHEMLKDFYRYIAADKELAWEGVMEKAGQIVDFLMDRVDIKPQRDGYADEVLRNLRGTKIQLSDSQRAEVEKLYGYENYRKTLFGAGIYLSKDGMELDSFWHEQASEFPGAFTEDVYEGDQPAELLRIIDSMREGDDSAAMEYAYNREFIRQGLMRAVYDSYWRVDNLKTVADRKQKEINEIRRKHTERMEAMNEEQRQTVRDLKDKRRADIAAVRKEYQEKNRKQIDAMRERYKENRARTNEIRSAAHQRKAVEKAVKDLMDMLSRPTKEAHVPMALQAPLEKFLNSIDFSSKRALAGGELTIKDVAYTRALQEVKTAIAQQRTALEGAADGTFSLDVPKDFLDVIEDHINLINKATEGLDLTTNRVYEMTSDELKDLAFILKTINKAIRDIDKLHMAGAKARVSELSRSTVREMGRRKAVKTEDGGRFMWRNYTPTFAFERMGAAATQVLNGLKMGQAKLARTAASVIKFSQETYTNKEVNEWENEIHEVELDSGKTVKMTTAQVMSFYCLSRREQARGHLNGGGIRMSNIGEGRKMIRQTEHFQLTQEDIARINGLLTDRQREVANKLQRYMADVGGKLGNEISMARWDYVEMTDRDYFPIRSDSDIHDAKNPDQDKTNLWALLNKSFTKQVTPGANDAMIVSSVFDVFADHMSDMAEYNAFALPLVDAMKWYNYRETEKQENGQIKTIGVKKAINDKLGTAAGEYFIDLMTDINSSQKAGRYEDFFGKLLSRSKAASVGWNLRVAIQQPTAILRASVYLDPKSLVKGTARIGMKRSAEEMKKYSGIALWKSLGYYDLNISRGIRDQIKGDTTLLDKINEKGMWLPGFVDERTWARIWESCKEQVRQQQKLTGERLLEETAKLFEEVVYHTQVADSVLTRSGLMRSKSQTMKEWTSFMAEPTLSVNLLMNAFQDYREGVSRGEKAKRTMKILFCGYVLSAIANAVVISFADAARDDDEYEGYWDKFFQALLGEKFYDGNLFAELNPLEKIVFVRDVLSLLRGYEGAKNPFVELAESGIKLVQNIVKFFQGKGSLTAYGLIYQSLQVLGGFTGAAPANLLREATTLWNWTFGKWNNMPVHRYKTSPKESIRNAYDSGAMTKSEARDALVASGESVTDAYWILKGWDAGENIGMYDDVYKATLAGEDIGTAVAELVEHGEKTEKEVLSQLRKQIKKWYTDPESDTKITREQAQEMVDSYLGLDLEESAALVEEWTFELENGYSYDDIKHTYLDNEITAAEAKRVLIDRLGKTEKEADRRIQYWDYLRDNRDSELTEYQVADFYEYAEPAGISKSVYEKYIKDTKGIEGEGTKVRKMEVIDSLPLSAKQKDALYFAEGWAKSNLLEAPWH